MTDYTPETSDVRANYVDGTRQLHGKNMRLEDVYAEFDRWLAGVKREAVADWQLERLAATIKATREDYNMGENK